MLLEPSLQQNVAFKYYESGHMVYVNPAELAKMHDDLAAWYDATLSDARSSTPPARPGTRSGEAGPN
jgi:carboxypeptidase C (cathepsin A)